MRRQGSAINLSYVLFFEAINIFLARYDQKIFLALTMTNWLGMRICERKTLLKKVEISFVFAWFILIFFEYKALLKFVVKKMTAFYSKAYGLRGQNVSVKRFLRPNIDFSNRILFIFGSIIRILKIFWIESLELTNRFDNRFISVRSHHFFA